MVEPLPGAGVTTALTMVPLTAAEASKRRRPGGALGTLVAFQPPPALSRWQPGAQAPTVMVRYVLRASRGGGQSGAAARSQHGRLPTHQPPHPCPGLVACWLACWHAAQHAPGSETETVLSSGPMKAVTGRGFHEFQQSSGCGSNARWWCVTWILQAAVPTMILQPKRWAYFGQQGTKAVAGPRQSPT